MKININGFSKVLKITKIVDMRKRPVQELPYLIFDFYPKLFEKRQFQL